MKSNMFISIYMTAKLHRIKEYNSKPFNTTNSYMINEVPWQYKFAKLVRPWRLLSHCPH